MTFYFWLLLISISQILFFYVWYLWQRSWDPLLVKIRSVRIMFVVGSMVWPLTLLWMLIWHSGILRKLVFVMSESPITRRRRELNLDKN